MKTQTKLALSLDDYTPIAKKRQLLHCLGEELKNMISPEIYQSREQVLPKEKRLAQDKVEAAEYKIMTAV